ncbi:MAG: hypothetical protein LUH82_03790 [Clostridiales bacterium]|nr:hypothetical protein [Clostridiales bacterium]
MLFINCSRYDFTDSIGKQIAGVTCKCFDRATSKIVKVKTDKVIDLPFGAELVVDVVPNGNYLDYVYRGA